jgi:hypothetical protein
LQHISRACHRAAIQMTLRTIGMHRLWLILKLTEIF